MMDGRDGNRRKQDRDRHSDSGFGWRKNSIRMGDLEEHWSKVRETDIQQALIIEIDRNMGGRREKMFVPVSSFPYQNCLGDVSTLELQCELCERQTKKHLRICPTAATYNKRGFEVEVSTCPHLQIANVTHMQVIWKTHPSNDHTGCSSRISLAELNMLA